MVFDDYDLHDGTLETFESNLKHASANDLVPLAVGTELRKKT
jgi:hypothetical protein